METTASHYGNWIGAIIFIILYSLVLLFVPFYKKLDKKPRTAFIAFVCAFAIEMFGIPFSFYIVSWLIGKNLPEGYLWGHTLINQIGYWGMYVNYICIFVAAILIIIMWLVIFVMYYRLAKKEEADMVQEFGDEYREYRKKTKMFVPFVF